MFYFKIKTENGIGKDLYALLSKANKFKKMAFDLAEELGFKKIAWSTHAYIGGIGLLTDPIDIVNFKNYKKVKGGYLPRLSTKGGKLIQAKIDVLPIISRGMISRILGLDPWSSLYINWGNNGFILVSSDQNLSKDVELEEITRTQFDELNINQK